MKNLFNALILLFFLSSCKQNRPAHPQEIISLINKSGHAEEIQKVLDHYASPADSLKLKASYFLLLSLQKNHFIEYNLIDKYFDYIKMVKKDINKGPFILAALKEIYGPYMQKDGTIKYDLQELNSKAIIGNIDLAFRAWKGTPWGKNISFDNFCEYILPFRMYNEYPDYEARKIIFEQFAPLIDSLKDTNSDILSAAKAVSKKLKVEGFQMTTRVMFLPNIRPSKLFAYRGGTCWDMSALTTFVMRSCGIPVTSDFVLQWPTRDGGHSWNVLIDEKGTIVPFSTYGQSFEVYSSKFLKKGKIFRNTTMPQQEALAMQKLDSDTIPDFFLNSKLKDVTEQYVSCFDVQINIPTSVGKHKYAYLCVFDNQNWIPIHWGKICKGRVEFNKMETDIVYLPGVYENGNIIPVAAPVILNKLGRVIELDPGPYPSKVNMKISSIHPLLPHYIKNNLLTGGLFQGSNHRYFHHPVDLYTIKNEPNMDWNSINLSNPNQFRYLRYQAPSEFEAQMGEMEFYSGQKLTGKIIESSNSKFPGSSNIKERAFDGDPMTYYQSRISGSWIGLDLGTPFTITKIRFTPVVKPDTTANIIPTHTYKLSYFRGREWKEIITIEASKNILTLQNVPLHGLYLLEDLTKSQRKRIFTYENGLQVWR